MTRKVDTRMAPWIGPREVRREAAKAQRDLDRSAPLMARDPGSLLGSVGVPEALVDAHGAALVDAAADLAALGFAGRALAPHRKRQLDLALKQLYAILGRALDRAAPRARAAIAAEITGALREVAEQESGKPQLVPALYATLGLIDLGVRRGAALADQARAVVLDLLDRTEGRAGQSALLGVLPGLAEHLDIAGPPANDRERADAWRATAQLLIDASPTAGADAQIAAAIAEHALASLAQPALAQPAPWEAALSSWRASHAARRDQLAASLDDRPVGRALPSLIEASPVGPEALFVSMERVWAALADREDLAPVIASLAASPAAGPLLDAIAGGGAEALLELRGDRRFEALGPGLRSATMAAFLAAPGGTASSIEALIERAQRLESDAPYPELRAFAERHAAASSLLANYPALDAGLAVPLADAEHASLPQMLEGLAQIVAVLPKTPAAEIVPALAQLCDPQQRFAVPPLSLLSTILDAVRPASRRRAASEVSGFAGPGPGAKRVDGELARLVLAIVQGLARIGSERHLRRAAEDLLPAVRSPRLGGAQSALAVRADHPLQRLLDSPLPAEVRGTAQRFLTPEQLDWAEAQVRAGGRDTSRAVELRDFIFGCVEAGRLDAIEAMRRSTSPRRAQRAAQHEIAQAFRTGTLPTVLFDPIVVGLRSGRAPMEDVQRAEDAGQLAIDLVALTSGRVTDLGREQIKASVARLNWLLSICVPGGPTYDSDIDMGSLRPVLLACIEAAATGQWPALKYENAAGQRMMAKLAPDQRALWRQSSVTPALAPLSVNDPRLERSAELARGMAVALPELIELGGEGLPPLGWDDASIENLEAARDDAIEVLRAEPKGTDRHRESVRILGAARGELALLALHRALVQTTAIDPAQAMLRLRTSLEEARTVLAERGGEGFREAAEEILSATDHLSGHAREGRYAVDDDSFPVMLNSITSGCLGPDFNGLGRQYGLVGALADANIRTVRVMDGDRQRVRGFVKFFEVALDGYRGPALFLDIPKPDGGGDDADLELWYRHAVAKAALMGLPLMIGTVDPCGDLVARLGAEAGLAVRRAASVQFFLDDGNTGYMHSDTLFEGKGNIRAGRGDQPVWSHTIACPTIVMPPGSV